MNKNKNIKYFLAVDIGNTHIVFGILLKDKVLNTFRVSTNVERTSDEFGLLLLQFCDLNKISLKNISCCGVSSVVQGLTELVAKSIKKYLKIDPLNVNVSLDLGIAILYKDPKQVGADRLCNSVAAFHKYGGPIIIIDFGTATTFDVLSIKGEYLGGIIIPGIETSSYDLQRRAAKLPKIELQFPEEIIGRETIKSMQSGILYGALDSTEGMIKRIWKSLNTKTKVITTGGLATLISEKSTMIDKIEQDLVLEGIKLICDRNTNR